VINTQNQLLGHSAFVLLTCGILTVMANH